MKYKVAVIETYKEIVEVEADSDDEALNIVWNRYQEEDSLGGDVNLKEVSVELA